MIIPPETFFQKLCGTSISSVVALRSKLNKIIEILSERIIMYGFHLFSLSCIQAPSIIGKTGKIQGANIVSTPAKNESISKIIVCLF